MESQQSPLIGKLCPADRDLETKSQAMFSSSKLLKLKNYVS